MTMHSCFFPDDSKFSNSESVRREEYLVEKYSDAGKNEDVVFVADRFINGLPARFVHYFFDYRPYTLADLHNDVSTHKLYESAKAACDEGDEMPMNDLIRRCANYAVARSMYNEVITEKLGFLQ